MLLARNHMEFIAGEKGTARKWWEMRLQAEISLRSPLPGHFSHSSIFPSMAKDTITKSDLSRVCHSFYRREFHGVCDSYALVMDSGNPSHKTALFAPGHC